MILAGICHSYKRELYEGIHRRDDEYRVALYPGTALITPEIERYDPVEEVTGTGYTAGGARLTGFRAALDGDVAYLDFDDPAWTGATITARGGLIYNASRENRAVAVIDLGAEQGSVNGTFRVLFPRPNGQTALIRLR